MRLKKLALLGLVGTLLLMGCGESHEAMVARLEKEYTEFLKRAVLADFKDPDSARFRNISYYTSGVEGKSRKRHPVLHVICGEVNAKNSLGGYVGYRNFYAMTIPKSADYKGLVDVQIDNPSDQGWHKMFSELEEKTCRNKTANQD